MAATDGSLRTEQNGKRLDYRSFDGAEGEVRVPNGEWYINTKARGRRMMANSLSSDARRVYACLELATMGWQQELAVIMDDGKTRPLTPGDIAKQTGLSRQHVRRGIEDLENAGLAERRAPDGGALRKGQVLLYSWALPRQPKEEDCSHARLQFPSWFPDSWEPIRPFITRLRLSLIDDDVAARGYIESVAEAARRYKDAEIGLTRALEPVCARPKREAASLYTKNGKILRERTSSSAVSDVQEAKPEPPVKAEEEDGSLYLKFKTNYPEGHFDEAKAKESFEKKLRAQQEHILERLQIYVACERWLDDGGRWIPLASTWLRSCFADPPPVLKKKSSSRSVIEAFMAGEG